MQIAETSICISLKLDVKQSPSGLDDSITVIRAVGGNARAFTGAHPPHAALGVPNPINVDETLRPAIDLDEVAGEFNTLSPPALFLFGRPGARCSSIDQRLSIAGRWRIAWYDLWTIRMENWIICQPTLEDLRWSDLQSPMKNVRLLPPSRER
ncbi:uncharacterized protein BDW47DRAFT_2784 [Aspergillus candidus]|uniref:Uncharacterized protein n=1 Tax=Aspergillus candidus TaxID=41067 RepID=A0A2I2FPS8_ASPCN|nr:hypothetical protein BDW47DRAFT_2784 [Aspergillus candidus]PLB42637.1 hypothetical protein BDW47DRAFT_2784 [Aspergillus candidus]